MLDSNFNAYDSRKKQGTTLCFLITGKQQWLYDPPELCEVHTVGSDMLK